MADNNEPIRGQQNKPIRENAKEEQANERRGDENDPMRGEEMRKSQ